jgi:hypothetical protein
MTMYTPEKDARRCALLGVAVPPTQGSLTYFNGASLKTLRTLNAEGFLDLEEAQNESPTVGEMMQFMRGVPSAKAHGYIVANDRNDRRISLEGLELDEDASETERAEFHNWIEETHPDEHTDRYAWWD